MLRNNSVIMVSKVGWYRWHSGTLLSVCLQIFRDLTDSSHGFCGSSRRDRPEMPAQLLPLQLAGSGVGSLGSTVLHMGEAMMRVIGPSVRLGHRHLTQSRHQQLR